MVRYLDLTVPAAPVQSDSESAVPESSPVASIDGCLTMLDRLLHLPVGQRESIVCELREHLLERSRDLTLRGMTDDEAARAALDELGSLTDLARRFHEAGRIPIRRRIMHGLTIGCGVLVAAAGAFYVAKPASQVQPSVFQQATGATAPPKSLEQRVDSFEYQDVLLRDVFVALERRIDAPVVVHWDALKDYGIQPDQATSIELRNVPLQVVMDSLERSLSRFVPTTWWYGERLIEFGPKALFDGRDKVLAAYDLTPIIDSMWGRFETPYEQAVNEVIGLLTEFVEPEQWVENGGAHAQARVVNGRLFIDAPARMHEKCQWILAELLKGESAMLGHGAGSATVPASTMPDEAARADEARVRTAATRMRDLFMAVQMFQQATPDEPITSLDPLVDRGYLTAERITSPFGPPAEGRSDILFDPTAANVETSVDLSKRIFAYDASMLQARGRTAAVFADGHVEILPAKAFAGILTDAANQGATWRRGSVR